MRPPFGQQVIIDPEPRRRGDLGFGPMIQQLREDRGVSREQFVRPLQRAGITPGDLGRLESGELRPSIEWINYCADTLLVDRSMLLAVVDSQVDAGNRMTVADARAYLDRHQEDGAVCPCCDRISQLRRRSFSADMAEFLAWLVQVCPPSAHPTTASAKSWAEQARARGGDYAKIAFWQLAERMPGKEPLWRPTLRGRDFVSGLQPIHSVAVVWRNTAIRFEGALIAFHEVPKRVERPSRAYAT